MSVSSTYGYSEDFGERHMRLAKGRVLRDERTGTRLLEYVQGMQQVVLVCLDVLRAHSCCQRKYLSHGGYGTTPGKLLL